MIARNGIQTTSRRCCSKGEDAFRWLAAVILGAVIAFVTLGNAAAILFLAGGMVVEYAGAFLFAGTLAFFIAEVVTTPLIAVAAFGGVAAAVSVVVRMGQSRQTPMAGCFHLALSPRDDPRLLLYRVHVITFLELEII
jgi:hypothetical protein